MSVNPLSLPLQKELVEALCEPVMDPFVPWSRVRLRDRLEGQACPVTVQFDDVITLHQPDGRQTLSRLGIINALLDQAVPGLRLIAHVPDDSGDHSPNNAYGLSLQALED